jgi:hypothetical protein
MDRGIVVEDNDLIDLAGWAKEGVEGLRKSVSMKEFEYYQTHSVNLDELTKCIPGVYEHKNFSYHRRKPTMELLVEALGMGKVCEVVLDSHALDGIEGFALHRVVVLGMEGDEVVFHDPRPEPLAQRRESIGLFKKAWLENVGEPELCIYSIGDQSRYTKKGIR